LAIFLQIFTLFFGYVASFGGGCSIDRQPARFSVGGEVTPYLGKAITIFVWLAKKKAGFASKTKKI